MQKKRQATTTPYRIFHLSQPPICDLWCPSVKQGTIWRLVPKPALPASFYRQPESNPGSGWGQWNYWGLKDNLPWSRDYSSKRIRTCSISGRSVTRKRSCVSDKEVSTVTQAWEHPTCWQIQDVCWRSQKLINFYATSYLKFFDANRRFETVFILRWQLVDDGHRSQWVNVALIWLKGCWVADVLFITKIKMKSQLRKYKKWRHSFVVGHRYVSHWRSFCMLW